SITAHVLLVYAAFAPRPSATWTRTDEVRPRPLAIERIHYTALGPENDVETRAAPAKPKVKARGQSAPQLALPHDMPSMDQIAVPGVPDLPADIDLRANVDDSTTFTSVRLVEAVKGYLVDPSTAGHTGPYTVASVDKAVRPYDNNPTP